MSLPEVINGWFTVAFSRDVPPGRIRVLRFMDRRIVLYRTQSGRVVALEETCSHLSTSFRHIGNVQGERLVCPEHGLSFDPAGVCTHLADGTILADRARRSFEVYEQRHEGLGIIWLWHHHEGTGPTWHLPRWDEPGWGRAHPALFRLRGAPQDVLENGCDLGHFECIHGAADVQASKLHTVEHHLTLEVRMGAPARMMLRGAEVTHATLRIGFYGLGLSFVESYVPSLGARMRSYVAPTPLGGGKMAVRCWIVVQEPAEVAARLPVIGMLLPRALGKPLMERLTHQVFVNDFRKDLPFLEDRRYLTRPALGRRDLYIGPFRKWARQFYPPDLLPQRAGASRVA